MTHFKKKYGKLNIKKMLQNSKNKNKKEFLFILILNIYICIFSVVNFEFLRNEDQYVYLKNKKKIYFT